jgi:hypothetical protein
MRDGTLQSKSLLSSSLAWCRHLCFFNLTIVNQERTPERRGGDQSVVVGPKAFAGIVEITWDDLGQLRNQDPH